MKPLSILLFWLLPAWPVAAQQAQDSSALRLSFHGYIKEMPSLAFVNPADSVAGLNLIHNRLRTTLSWKESFTVRAELRNRFFFGNQVQKTPGWAEALDEDDGLVDLSFVPVSGSNYFWHLNVDRLYASWSHQKWDISLGRQRINWGIHTVWNPNDLFNAYNYLDFDYEERPGSDALRVQYNLRPMSTLDLAWRVGSNKYDHTAAIRYQFNLREYDVQVLSGIMKKDFVLGAGWAGNAGNAGFKGEASWFLPMRDYTDSAASFSLTLGMDYTNARAWYFNGSYLLQTGGSNNASLMAVQLLQAGTAKQLLPFRHSLFGMASKNVHPLLNVGFSTIYAPGGANYLILFPTLTWQYGTNSDLSFFVQSVWGKQEVYKSLGNALYLRWKWSF